MKFKKYITEVKAFQWFPGMSAPWKIIKIDKDDSRYFTDGKEHYIIDQSGGEFNHRGPCEIFPGDYIIMDTGYSWMPERLFLQKYKPIK